MFNKKTGEHHSSVNDILREWESMFMPPIQGSFDRVNEQLAKLEARVDELEKHGLMNLLTRSLVETQQLREDIKNLTKK